MNSYIHRLTETTKFLTEIEEEYPNSILWEMLHIASWHYKVDWVLWVEENKEYINRIKFFGFESMIDKNVTAEFYQSVSELKGFEK